MLMTIGRGMSLAALPMKQDVLPDDPRVSVFYDSLGGYFKTNASAVDGYNTQMTQYFTTAGGVQDMAQDGCFLLKSAADAIPSTQYLIDDTDVDPANWSRSALYSSLYGALTTSADSSDAVILFGGVNDSNPAAAMSKDRYKDGLQVLKAFVQADFVDVKFIILNIMHRIEGNAAYDQTVQAIKEAQLETITEDGFFKRGIEFYDQDLRDSVHPSDAAFAGDMAARQARNLAYHAGQSVDGAFGPSVADIDFDGALNVNVQHDGGSDISVPATAADSFALRLGSNIYKPSSAARLSSSVFDLRFDNAGLLIDAERELSVGYGAISALSQLSPGVVADNYAGDAMPLQTQIVDITDEHPVWDLQDLVYCMDAETVARSYSGSDVTALTDNLGKTFSSTSGRYPQYSNGFLTTADTTTHMLATSTFTASSTGFGGIVLDIPASVPNERPIFAFGASGTGNVRTNIRIMTNGNIRWSRNDSDGYETISTQDHRGSKVVILWNFKGVDDVDFYVNSPTPYTFNPRDSLGFQNQAILFAERNNYQTIAGLGIGYFFHKNQAHDAVHDPSIASIMNFLSGKYGVTLS